MYCSSCGSPNARKLTFCTRCGAKLSANDDAGPGTPPIKPESLVFGAIAVFVFGLIAINLLLMTMHKVGLNEGLIAAFALASFLTLLSVEGTFLWLLVSRVLRKEGRRDAELPRTYTTNELSSAPAQTLIEPVPSAVEHTTRNLEPSLRPRTSGNL